MKVADQQEKKASGWDCKWVSLSGFTPYSNRCRGYAVEIVLRFLCNDFVVTMSDKIFSRIGNVGSGFKIYAEALSLREVELCSMRVRATEQQHGAITVYLLENMQLQ
ncbi:uncharacterized protein PHALS_13145 [Plasmopara halstedii]|uniref:Uncharacterized protein n=1 Tax=Plasmopara halstedii TaxID=4781 RepID=A0A0P1ANZ1_PLAHL|nr:uncharacterized protein PHALS_13145 [Plasmopara halstedii]CEG42909.1 hypothetical protein PHALS_13145 [Plasmopara halstedii]|eukprot:XP_024579278.1 hypothetical protein PHALS_13145 [Plasmopara halstedii]